MTASTSVFWFQAAHAVGLALWLSIAALNNARDFRGAMAAVGATMSMLPLAQAPAVPTRLRSRALASPAWHGAALLTVLALQLLGAICAWGGSYVLLVQADLPAALPWLNSALLCFAAFIFAMHLGGLWWAYWIRQEGLQLTHLVLLLWVMALFFLFNSFGLA